MAQIHKLKFDAQFKLMKLVEADFEVRKQSDKEYAEYATEALGFLVNENNVGGARRALGIEGTARKVSASAVETRLTLVESRLVLVEKRLAELEEKFNRHTNDHHHADNVPPFHGRRGA